MNEHQLRSAVYALDLKPNTKLTLLGVMCFVNWDTWSGPCSAKDVAKKMSMNERAVKRALKELTDLNILKRSAQRRAANNHHRAVTEVNVPMIMGGDNKTLPPSDIVTPPSDIVTLPPSDIVTPPSDNKTLPPSDIMTLPPSDIVTPNTTEDYNRGSINLESTEDTQPTSPDQDAETVEAVEAVEVGDSDLPSELIGLSAEYIQLLREHAADHQCSLLEAYEYAQRINRNAEAKLAWRREREKSAMFNRPTTAYRPKPLY
jgi:hypothetical protein